MIKLTKPAAIGAAAILWGVTFPLAVIAHAGGGSFSSSSGTSTSGSMLGGSSMSGGGGRSGGSFTSGGRSGAVVTSGTVVKGSVVTGRGGHVGSTFVTSSRPGGGSVTTGHVFLNKGTGRQSRGSTWVAFGGHTAGGNVAVAGTQAGTNFRTHPVWDHRMDHLWNGHRYHWMNGAWYISDSGEYPYAPITEADQNPLYDEPAPLAATGGAFNSPIPTTEAAVQSALEDAGYYTGAIDGTLNQGTVQAIAHFQRDHGLPPTGQVDDALLNALFSR